MDDLGGRDFTINAMAVRLGGRAREPGRETVKLLDPHHGVADLEQQRIRMTSAAALRADPLRMLRAVRYFAVLEGFHIESATLAAIVAGAADIEVAADERVQAEWARLLAAPRWAAATRLAFDVGLGERTLGFAVRLDAVDAWSRRERERGARLPVEELTMLRLAAIIAGTERATIDAAAPALVRRRWPRRLAQPAARIAAWAVGVGEASDTIAWALDDRDCAARAALLAQALVDPEDARLSARIEELALHAERAAEEPWVTGADLRSWGLEEGPRLGALLQEAARGQLERRWDSAAEARSWARRRAGATPAERTG
jgi:tRNA nucleotidyltransferase/poly(A) polymerase